MLQNLLDAGDSPETNNDLRPPAAPTLPRGRVMIADDAEAVRRLLVHFLKGTNAEIVEAENGRVACNAAFDAQNRRADFDLILLDMDMPALNGYDAATMLRLQGFTGPIVALTASDEPGEREKCLASGCSEYLHKPVARDALVRLVNRHLAARTTASPAVDASNTGAGIDAALRPFVDQFLASLPRYADRLEQLLRERSVEQLAQTMHQIKGAAGMYAFDHIEGVAAKAEAVAKTAAGAAADPSTSAAKLKGEVDALIRVIRGTRGYPNAEVRVERN